MDLKKSFLRQLQLEGKRQSTIDEYGRRITKFFDFLGGTDPRIIRTRDITKFREELLEAGMSNRSINSIVSTVSVFYSWMRLMEEVQFNPVPDNINLKVRVHQVHRISDEDLRTFLTWIDSLQENLRAAFWLMYGTGARVGEITKLEYTDITMIDGRIYINIEDAKWGSDRKIPVIDQEAAEIVWKFRDDCSITGEPIFHISRRTMQSYATKFANETGITFHCHLLRHTFASRLLEQNVPITTIKYLLGHKTLNMTAHYTQSALIDVSSITPTVFQERGNGAPAAGDFIGN